MDGLRTGSLGNEILEHESCILGRLFSENQRSWLRKVVHNNRKFNTRRLTGTVTMA